MNISIINSKMNLHLFICIYLLNYCNISYGQESEISEIFQDENELENRNIEDCKPLWYNKCKEASDCCSKKCTKGNPSWEYGICHKNDGQIERMNIKVTCKPLWFNKCTKDSDCCSKKCKKGQPDWKYGVCDKNGKQPGEPNINQAQFLVSVDEFQKCATSFGYGTPSANIANAFISQAQSKGGITSKLEAFMAIAQFSWESAGFTARSEWACSGGRWSARPCESYSTEGCPAGRNYYGRGFIQLTHCYNYKAASVDFPGIVENPDLVATDDRIAMGTALWFWKTNVHNNPGVQEGAFGSTTRAINGGLECTPNGNTQKGRERWNKFNGCLQSAGAKGLNPKEKGCY